MKRRGLVVLLFAAGARGHAVLRDPTPRQGWIDGAGPKLTPFSDASDVANRRDGGDGCGGSDNNDPGRQFPTEAFQPGDIIRVAWEVTIPHTRDNRDSGVRIALHYSDSDSYQDNILAGELADDDEGGSTVSACEGMDDDNCDYGGRYSYDYTFQTVTLPNKTCSCCTLQWLWAARSDNGFYIGCADIAITEDGELPTVPPTVTPSPTPQSFSFSYRSSRTPGVDDDDDDSPRGPVESFSFSYNPTPQPVESFSFSYRPPPAADDDSPRVTDDDSPRGPVESFSFSYNPTP